MQAGHQRQEETPQIPLIVVRIPVETSDVDQFIVDYRRYFGADILFLPTDIVHPTGHRVHFAFELADGREVVWGEGVVLRARKATGRSDRPPGMELRYGALDERSQHVIDRMLSARLDDARKNITDPPPYVSMSVQPSEEHTLPRPPAPEEGAPEEPMRPRSRSSRTTQRVLPANPLCDVPESAIEYFVDWAVERNTAPNRTGKRRMSTSFAAVTMTSPRRPRTMRLRMFAMGATLGVAVGAAVLALIGGSWAMRARPRFTPPRAMVASAGIQPASAPLAPPPARKESSARAEPPAPKAPAAKIALAKATPEKATPEGAALEPTVAEELAAPIAPPTLKDGPPPEGVAPLTVTTKPAGAHVSVDGHPAGRTPLTLSVEAGTHEVVIERQRYAPVRVAAAAPGRVVVHLDRPMANLRITSTPQGATVRLRGRTLGATPLEVESAAYERYHLEIEQGGRVERRRIYLQPPMGLVDVEFRNPTRRQLPRAGRQLQSIRPAR